MEMVTDVNWIKYFIALASLAALLGGFALIVRYFSTVGVAGFNNKKRNRRLKVMETLYLDGRRRLTLVRMDNAEHLILMGPSGEMVIESRWAEAQEDLPEQPPIGFLKQPNELLNPQEPVAKKAKKNDKHAN